MNQAVLSAEVFEAHEDAPCGYLLTTDSGVIFAANRLVREWTGRSAASLQGGTLRLQDLLTPASRIFHDTHYSSLMVLQGFASEVSFEFTVIGGAVARFPVLMNAQQRVSPDGTGYRSITLFNATETRRHERALVKARREAEANAEALVALNEALDAQNQRLQVTLDSIADAVVTTDAAGCIESMNAAAERLCGLGLERLRHARIEAFGSLLCGESRLPCPHPVDQSLHSLERIQREVDTVLVRPDGEERIVIDSASPLHDAGGAVIGTVFVCRDVTAKRHIATHDALTGLLNRGEFERRIMLQRSADQSSRQATGETHAHAVFFIGLDQFQLFNDSVGHQAGDEMLQAVAAQLRRSMRQSDILARLGGDTFGVLLQGCHLEDALTIAESLRSSIALIEPPATPGSSMVTATIGVAATNTVSGIGALFADAELACTTAKESGRNRCFHFGGQALLERRGEMHWASRIDRALTEDRFVLFCQPIVPIGALAPGAAPRKSEILLRLQGEDGRLLSPAAFIPAAERYGKMQDIDRWVMRSAFAWMQATPDVHCSINVSGQSLGEPAFLAYVIEQLLLSELDATRVTFEITETAAVASIDAALAFMQSMRTVGARFALDDFGAGLASFSYLKTFPVDIVKIDGSFVRQMQTDVQSRVIVESIQRIAAASGLQTVAEWVENDETIEMLRVIGVDFAQGYGTGKPVAVAEWALAVP